AFHSVQVQSPPLFPAAFRLLWERPMADQYTRKSRDALASAQAAAQAAGKPELTPAHLAVALLSEPEGVMSALLAKLDVDARVLATELSQRLEKLPRTSGGQVSMSRALAEVLQDANATARKMGDTFTST